MTETKRTMTKLPFDPFWAVALTVSSAKPDQRCDPATVRDGVGLSPLARWMGVHPKQMQRWSKEGFTLKSADVAANIIGLHPIEIWGDQWLEPGPMWDAYDKHPRLARTKSVTAVAS